MGKEIERKFVLEHLPKFVVLSSVRSIEQNYLITGEEEIRIRKEKTQLKLSSSNETRLSLTLKKGSGLEREENETEINEDTYNRLKSLMTSAPIKKTRGITHLKGLKIEIDTYENPELEGLIVAEIEFDTAQEAQDAILPKWLGVDVTEDDSYKNQKLWEKIKLIKENEEEMEDRNDFDESGDEESFLSLTSEADSYTIERIGIYGEYVLVATYTDKEQAILRAHSLLTHYDTTIIRGWYNGDEVSSYTIKREE